MRHSPRTEFALLAQRPEEMLDLEALCLSIARIARPHLDTGQVSQTLDALAASVAEQVDPSAPPDRLASALARSLGGTLGLCGEEQDFEKLDASMLDQVVELRRGLPILLGVVWILLGKRLSLPILGVNYPGHFLVCLERPGARIYLDPFSGGQALDARLLLRGGDRSSLLPVGPRPILHRILANIRNWATPRQQWGVALEAVERMQLLSGEEPTLVRDRGLICMQLQKMGDARRDLERYLLLLPDAMDRSEVEQLLATLRAR